MNCRGLERVGVNPGEQKKECGGKCLSEPPGGPPTGLRALPAEIRTACLVNTGQARLFNITGSHFQGPVMCLVNSVNFDKYRQ